MPAPPAHTPNSRKWRAWGGQPQRGTGRAPGKKLSDFSFKTSIFVYTGELKQTMIYQGNIKAQKNREIRTMINGI